jgi:DNA-binding response OmpR family regulator
VASGQRALASTNWTTVDSGCVARSTSGTTSSIFDLGLPSIDGLSILKALSREQPDVPVLIRSARSDLRTRLAAFSLGACDYLEKPFAFHDLLARVRECAPQSAAMALERSVP